jgi:hypothetical protein
MPDVESWDPFTHFRSAGRGLVSEAFLCQAAVSALRVNMRTSHRRLRRVCSRFQKLNAGGSKDLEPELEPELKVFTTIFH